MLPGPVFNLELVTTSRRARYYALRFFYGAILLAVVWQNDPAHYHWYYGATRAEMTIQQAADLGDWLFRSFAVAQSIAVLFVTPAYVAGVIADEKQRKTLHYLLSSRLTSSEIVLGKLCARLLHVFVLVGVGLPVLSLLGLFGGVAPELVALTFFATLTVVLFVASCAILVSVYARRSRDAVGMVYLLELAWLFLPLVIAEVLPLAGWPWFRMYEWIRPVNDLIGSSSPLYVMTRSMFRARGAGAFNAYLWMVGLQVAGAALFLLLAVVRLRPVFRSHSDVSRWVAWLEASKRGRRLLPRPACGDDAMLWKECYVSRTSVLAKLIGGFFVIGLGGLIAYAAYQTAVPAFTELLANGYGSASGHSERDALNLFVRGVSGFAYVAWLLGVASAASSGVVSERESDTWTSLMATPLEGLEIVRAKIIGAIWSTRWLGAVLLAVFTLGLAGGAVHPFGYVAAVFEVCVFITFAATLGTFISLRSKNSGRAMTATVGILVVLNGGYMLCCIPLRPDTMFILVGVTPSLEVMSLLTYQEMRGLIGFDSTLGNAGRYVEGFLACFVGTVAYGAAALALMAACVGTFDDVVDRPTRSGQYPPYQPSKEGQDDDEGIAFE